MMLKDNFAQATDNLERNRTTTGKWFHHTADFTEAAPNARIRPEAREIVERCQTSLSIAELTGHAPRPNETNCLTEGLDGLRLRSDDARRNAQTCYRGTEKWYDFEGNLGYTQPQKPMRIGAGDHGREIAKQMTQKVDWLTDTPCNNEVTAARSPSGYQRRNQPATWFCHDAGRNDFVTPNRQRLRLEGVENSAKSRGTDDLLRMQAPQTEVQSGPYGCPTTDSRLNSRWSTGGDQVAGCLGRSPDVIGEKGGIGWSDKPNAKVRGQEAREWQQRGTMGSLGPILARASVGEQVRPNTASRVRPEAMEYHNRSISGSQLQDCLLVTESSRRHLPPDVAITSQHQRPRVVSNEATLAMQRNRGTMDEYLGGATDSVTASCTKKIHPRSIRSSDGQMACERSKGGALKELINNDRLKPDPLETSVLRVNTEDASALAQRSRQGLVGNLLGMATPTEVPLVGLEADKRRRVQYEAVGYADRNTRSDSMFAALHQKE